jgi:hypothetical protein
MKLATETQIGSISDDTRARVAMVRPILRATLFALEGGRVDRLGGYPVLTLRDLAREYREGDGDCGICFEYAIHEAIERGDPLLQPRISEVLGHYCKVAGEARSILFGAEKGRKLELLETDVSLITPESRLLVGTRNSPVRLKAHLERVRKAFYLPEERRQLPRSIRGLWRADLFVGVPAQERWVATTLKTNPSQLEGAAGIRIGIFPEQRKGEPPSFDQRRNLILCPVPYDGSFMDLFYSAFFLVKAFLSSDAKVPKPVELPLSTDRHVARLLEERRDFAVLDVIEALEKMAQPDLLTSGSAGDPYSATATSAIAPIARKTSLRSASPPARAGSETAGA